jgi:ADP-ribosylglycohydrolase
MTRERYRGALLGLAAGDALGSTLEFKPPGTFAPLADTTGAIYGQIAGAFYGAEQIPPAWRAILTMHDFIQEKADQLFAIAQPSNPDR